MTTSRFKLDRDLLAALLGFDGPVENFYDANHGQPSDCLCEVAQVMSLISIQISRYMQDFNALQMTSRPWLQLTPGSLMSISSAMPQKRNPRALQWVRSIGSIITGQSQGFLFAARNQLSGMSDIRDNMARLPDDLMIRMLTLVADIVLSLNVNAEKAREECSKDYSTMIDIAESLYVKRKIPFRIGPHFASLLSDYGRINGIYPLDIPYIEAPANLQIY